VTAGLCPASADEGAQSRNEAGRPSGGIIFGEIADLAFCVRIPSAADQKLINSVSGDNFFRSPGTERAIDDEGLGWAHVVASRLEDEEWEPQQFSGKHHKKMFLEKMRACGLDTPERYIYTFSWERWGVPVPVAC
jgi:hypothetical protein